MNPNYDFDTALHEGGHSVCAAHFKIPAFPEVLDEGWSAVTQNNLPECAGLCTYDDGGIPPFQFAVICWGGQMAQCVFGTPPSWAPPYRPTALLLRDWWAAMLVQIKRFSDGDRAGILASYENSWRACKTAYRITKTKEKRIARLAKALLAGRDPKPAVPMPDQFPAPLSDFLRLVVIGSDAETKFTAFIHAQSEKFLTDGQFVFATPAQLQDGINQWTAARMAHFQKGFPDSDSWVGQARVYRAWTKTKKSTDQSK
jgi:hypothetical protein